MKKVALCSHARYSNQNNHQQQLHRNFRHVWTIWRWLCIRSHRIFLTFLAITAALLSMLWCYPSVKSTNDDATAVFSPFRATLKTKRRILGRSLCARLLLIRLRYSMFRRVTVFSFFFSSSIVNIRSCRTPLFAFILEVCAKRESHSSMLCWKELCYSQTYSDEHTAAASRISKRPTVENRSTCAWTARIYLSHDSCAL